MHRVSRPEIERRRLFVAWSCAFGIALCAGLVGASVRAARKSPVQAPSSQTTAVAALTVERIYSAPSLSGDLTRGIEWSPDAKRISYLERNPQGNKDRTELWTMDAATGERKVLVNSETLEAVTQPQKTQATQATGIDSMRSQTNWRPIDMRRLGCRKPI